MDQQQLDELLINSAYNGQLREMKRALQQGANVNAENKNNCTSLCLASRYGYIDIVQYLLDCKADPDIPNKWGETALHISSGLGHKIVVEVLLRHQANISAVNENVWTALHSAAFNNYPEIIKVLIISGADITALNKNGNTALMLACQRGFLIVADLLLEQGANTSIINEDSWTALHIAAFNNHPDLIELLINNGADITVVTKDGWTALHFAAYNNHPNVTKVLIGNGADITVVDKNGSTPAELAQSRGNRDMAKLIIDEALQRLFKRGLHKGNVQLTNIRLVLMGPPCVGKTSFKSLLFNWSAPKFHNSTALATRPIRALEMVAGRNEGKIWEKVTSLDLLRMLSDAIHALEQDSQQETDDPISENDSVTAFFTDSPQEFISNENSTSITGLAKQKLKSDIVVSIQPNQTERETSDIASFHMSLSDTTMSTDKATQPVDSNTSPTKEVSSYITNEKADQYSQKLSKLFSEQKATQNRHKATWINVLDSGGQPQFADVSRAFVRGNTINIICTKLTESLFEKPQFCYSLNGKLLNQPSELQMNNLQLIEHFVRSIVSSKNAIVKGSKSLPLFMIIGTCYDKIKRWKKKSYEPLEFKNEQLLSTLSEFHDHFIFHNDEPKKIIFPVDNLCWWNRKKISSSLRQHIMSYKKDIGIAAPIPVRWYMFELRIKEEASQEEHGMISLEICHGIGVSLGMNGNDILKSLSHLHIMALFLYFPIVLPNVIFTNPQYLLDMLSSLIRVSFIDSLEDILHEGKSIAPDTQRAFREFGIFDESLLDNICLPFVSSLFTKHAFLMLLRYLRIITPLSTTDGIKRYFMPVVLPPQQAKEKDIVLFQQKCDPMIIRFRNKVVPQGVFPALVVALVERTGTPQFDIDSCSIAFPRQLRYAVLLYSEDLFGSVLLVDRFYWIEVYYNGMTENCFKLHKVICEAISACADILAYDEGALKAEVTVPCKQEHSESGHKLHPVIISWDHDPPLKRCSIEKQLPTLELIDERQTCWLFDPCSVTSKGKRTTQHDELGPEIPNILSKNLAHNSGIIPVSSNLPNGPLDECHLSVLVKFLKEVDDWEILGIHLGIKDAVIKDIKALNHFQPAPSRKDMLVTWLKSGCANREDFIEALKAIGELRIVQEIISQNDQTTTECQNTADVSINIGNKLELISLLYPIAHKWKEIGEALSIRDGDLENLCDKRSCNADRLSGVIQIWFDKQTCPLKWSTIIIAVKLPPVYEPSIAESILLTCLSIKETI